MHCTVHAAVTEEHICRPLQCIAVSIPTYFLLVIYIYSRYMLKHFYDQQNETEINLQVLSISVIALGNKNDSHALSSQSCS